VLSWVFRNRHGLRSLYGLPAEAWSAPLLPVAESAPGPRADGTEATTDGGPAAAAPRGRGLPQWTVVPLRPPHLRRRGA
jgi:hypothetical protein